MYFPSELTNPFLLHIKKKPTDVKTVIGHVEKTIDAIRAKVFSAYQLLETFKVVHSLIPTEDRVINLLGTEIVKSLEARPCPSLSTDPNPEEVRSYLQIAGCLPSAEEAKAVYWSLGEDWWKQIIDGSDHVHGKWVYDKGLHESGMAEQGYLNGIYEASQFFTRHFHIPFDLTRYSGIHYLTCAHFNGSENNTQCTFEKKDRFRTNSIICTPWDLRNERLAHDKATTIKQELLKIQERYALEQPFSTCSVLEPTTLCVRYLDYNSEHECQEITGKVINAFNANLFQIQKEACTKLMALQNNLTVETLHKRIEIKEAYRPQAIRTIGQLFAELEWFHPWRDGQGRTDIIMLAGLLCKEGAHPARLHDPYYSTYEQVDNWIHYLRRGLDEFDGLLLAKIAENPKPHKSKSNECTLV